MDAGMAENLSSHLGDEGDIRSVFWIDMLRSRV